MEEKRVPWWRKALSFALDGIRSRFGLFSKSAKENPVDQPEIAPAQQEPPEESELTQHSSELEPMAAAANEAGSGAVSEAVDDRLLRAETEPQQVEPEEDEPEGGGGFDPRTEPSESEEA